MRVKTFDRTSHDACKQIWKTPLVLTVACGSHRSRDRHHGGCLARVDSALRRTGIRGLSKSNRRHFAAWLWHAAFLKTGPCRLNSDGTPRVRRAGGAFANNGPPLRLKSTAERCIPPMSVGEIHPRQCSNRIVGACVAMLITPESATKAVRGNQRCDHHVRHDEFGKRLGIT